MNTKDLVAIFDEIGEALESRNFTKINKRMAEIDLVNEDLTVILGYVRGTSILPAEKLPARAKLIEAFRQRVPLERDPEEAEKLLKRLE